MVRTVHHWSSPSYTKGWPWSGNGDGYRNNRIPRTKKLGKYRGFPVFMAFAQMDDDIYTGKGEIWHGTYIHRGSPSLSNLAQIGEGVGTRPLTCKYG